MVEFCNPGKGENICQGNASIFSGVNRMTIVRYLRKLPESL